MAEMKQVVESFRDEGLHYRYSNYSAMAASAVHNVVVETPNTDQRLKWFWDMKVSNLATYSVFETITYTGGTTVTAINSDRNSALTADAIMLIDPSSVTVSGATTVETGQLSSHQVAALGDSEDEEDRLILKANEKYLFQVTNDTSANKMTFRHLWMEKPA